MRRRSLLKSTSPGKGVRSAHFSNGYGLTRQKSTPRLEWLGRIRLTLVKQKAGYTPVIYHTSGEPAATGFRPQIF